MNDSDSEPRTRLTGLPRSSHLQVIDRLLRSFSQCPSREAIAELLLAALAERTGAERLAFLAWEKRFRFFSPIAFHGHLPRDAWQASFHPKPGILWEMVQDDQPFMVADGLGQFAYPSAFEGTGLEILGSVTWVPASCSKGLSGIVSLDIKLLGDEQRASVRLMASRAAEAMRALAVTQENQALKKELNRRKAALATFEEWGSALLHLEDQYEQLEELLDKARTTLDADKGSVMLIDTHTDELVVRAVQGLDEKAREKLAEGLVPSKRIKVGEGVAGQVARTGQPRILNEVAANKGFVEPESSFARSLLCVPLKIDGLILGVMNFTNKKNGEDWTRRDLRQATRLARQAAQAINNARLYQLAVTDPFTGLANRVHFHHRLGDELLRARRNKTSLSLALVRVENLPTLRQLHDHETVNGVVKKLAQCLYRACRRTDTVARLGEATFALTLPNCDAYHAEQLTERIREEVAGRELMWSKAKVRLDLRCALSTSVNGQESESQLLDDCQEQLKATAQGLLLETREDQVAVG